MREAFRAAATPPSAMDRRVSATASFVPATKPWSLPINCDISPYIARVPFSRGCPLTIFGGFCKSSTGLFDLGRIPHTVYGRVVVLLPPSGTTELSLSVSCGNRCRPSASDQFGAGTSERFRSPDRQDDVRKLLLRLLQRFSSYRRSDRDIACQSLFPSGSLGSERSATPATAEAGGSVLRCVPTLGSRTADEVRLITAGRRLPNAPPPPSASAIVFRPAEAPHLAGNLGCSKLVIHEINSTRPDTVQS